MAKWSEDACGLPVYENLRRDVRASGSGLLIPKGAVAPNEENVTSSLEVDKRVSAARRRLRRLPSGFPRVLDEHEWNRPDHEQ